jgi:lysophospholipase L1-like esterase
MRAHAFATALACLCALGTSACTRKDSPATDAPSLVPTAAAAGTPIASTEPKAGARQTMATSYRLMGRFVREPSGKGWRMAWPGSAMIARFKGTSISIRIKEEGNNLFQVVVDGETKKPLRTDKAKDLYVLAEGLPDAQHDVVVERRTEAKVGEAVFLGFEPGPGAVMMAPPPAPERRIEIIGDSISTGYGNEGPGAACGYVNSQQNEYLAYGAITARNVDADHTTIAWSGKTLYEMREYFDKALPARGELGADSPKWDFAHYQPHAVVLNIGTNNFAIIDPGEKRFVELYLALFAKVRAAYPKAFVVCALGPMLSDVYPEGRHNLTQARKYMKAVMQKLDESGEKNTAFLEFPEQNHADGLGCGFHPSLKTHKLMSDRLTAMLKERMGW